MSTKARAERFKAPPDCQEDCKSIVVKELNGEDEVAAAVNADQKMGQPGFKADNFAAIMKLERQERVRQSVVAVDNKLVRPDKPLDMEKFGSRTKAWIGRCFGKLNDPDEEMLKKSLAEGEAVDLGQLTSGEAATEEPNEG